MSAIFIYVLLLVLMSQNALQAQECAILTPSAISTSYVSPSEIPQVKVIFNPNDAQQLLGPATDQGSAGTCFAYTGADLVELELKKVNLMPIEEKISPLSFAFEYYMKMQTPYEFFRNRDASELINEFNLQGKILKNKMKNYYNLDKKEKAKLLVNVYVFSELYKRLKNKIERSCFNGGGSISLAILNHNYSNLCYESELNSDYDSILNYIEAELSLCGKTMFDTNGYEQLMLALFPPLSPSSAEECAFECSVKAIFPEASRSNISDLSIATKDNIIGELMSKFCKPKKQSISEISVKVFAVDSGKVQTFNSSSSYLKKYFQDTDDKQATPKIMESYSLQKFIDDNLQMKKAVGISYDSALFNFPSSDSAVLSHGSSIVGKINMCNENFYVLRNSWGKDACLSKFNNYLEMALLQENKNGNYFKDISSHGVPALGSIYWNKLIYSLNIPFLCDDHGNFLIRENVLIKNTNIAEVVEINKA
jgi:hypothetical protein